jgi:uncharacterized protein involved in exopolysaccharide biosynthesis
MYEQGPDTGVDRGYSEEREPEGITVERVREMAGFMVRATRRHIKLAIVTFFVVAGAGVGIAWTMPKVYSARVKLLAQRSSAIRVLSSPNPGMEAADNPTRNIAATILSRDNLVALAKDAKLVERFDETRPSALKLKDRLMDHLFSPPTAEDKLLRMVFTLEKQLEVTVDDANVTITVDWANPRVAYDLANLVQKNFLEARYDSDVAEINDSIGVLEDHAKSELAKVDAKLDEYTRIAAERSPRPVATDRAASAPLAVAVPIPWVPRPGAGNPLPIVPDRDVAKTLEDTRARIRTTEEDRQRKLDDVRQQLMQAQLTLTPMHPTVIALQQQVENLSQPPAELAQLRAQERALMAQIAPPMPSRAFVPSGAVGPGAAGLALGAGRSGPLYGNGATADAGSPAPTPLLAGDKDPQVQLAESELTSAVRAYEDVLDRIDAAKVELDITRAAYKHRYMVVTPAEEPRAPKKAQARVIGAASVIGALLLAILLATGLDMLPGVILEPWQVRRHLKLDVIGELDNPS